jgi:hypothetical protein
LPPPFPLFVAASWFSDVAARKRACEHDREIVLADHQIGGFDLPHSRHLTQNVEHLHRARCILQGISAASG